MQANTLAVIVVTIDRPDCVRRCLEHLRKQNRPLDEIVVVDGAESESAKPVVDEFDGVLWVKNPNGFGRMTGSRNLGLLHTTSEFVAFLDDDAYAEPQWSEALLAAYDASDIGAVGGRALNDGRGESSPAERIGRIYKDGTITGGFGSDSEMPLDVDHVIGCNMSFRSSVLAELGGFNEFYPGFCCTYEEADLCMRIKRAGYRIRFAPHAVVNHVPAPRRVGRRFDARYVFGVTRNHCTLVIRNWGYWSGAAWLIPTLSVWRMGRVLAVKFAKETAKLGLKLGAVIGGALTGVVGGLIQRVRQGDDLVRRDGVGRQITEQLRSGVSKSEAADVDAEPSAEVSVVSAR